MADADVSVLGTGLVVQGTVSGEEELHVEGTVEGTVELRHHLHVLEPGAVHGEISVVSTSMAGQASGRVTAQDFIQLLPGANVKADLKAPRIILEEGSHFVGRIEMDFSIPE